MSDWSAPVRRGRGAVLDAGVLLTALALALLPLLPVYGSTTALRPILGGLALGGLVAAIAAWRRWSAVVTVAATLVAYLLLGGVLAAPSAAPGVLPTMRSLGLLLTGLVTVWKQVLTLDPALGQSGNLLAAPYLLALVGSVTALSLALRVPGRRAALAALVPLGVLGLAVLLGTKATVQPVAAGLVMAVLLLGWAARRAGGLAPRRVVSLLLVVGVVAVSGGVVGPVVGELRPRFVLRDELVPPFDPRDQPSPLSAFRKFVKDWKDTELLTVRGLPEGGVVRLATMDAYDGVVWNVAGSEAAQGSGQFRRIGERVTTSVQGERTAVELEVHTLPFVWLPTVGWTERFDFRGPGALDLASDLRYNDATGTAVLTRGVPDGTRWTAEVVVPVTPDENELGTAAPGSVRLPEPIGVPEAVPLFAGDLAGSATTPALIAGSLAGGLSDRGWFSHGQTASGDAPSLSGHGSDRITTLLTADLMVGDAEQYASAMALMARSMGLPARVVLGFVPDEEQSGAEITLTGDDIEAWVEIAFSGYGWVPFFPTPDESKTVTDETPVQESEPQPQVRQPPLPPEDPASPPDDDTEQAQTQDTEQDLQRDEAVRAVLTAVGVGSIPLVLVGGPLLLVAAAKRRRRRRRRTQGPPVARVVGGWDELLDHARDMRRPPPERATRRETAVHLAGTFVPTEARGRSGRGRPTVAGGGPAGRGGGRRAWSVGGPVAGLAAGADAMVFGPGEPTPEQVEAYWAQVDVAVEAMRAVLPRRQRWRARWSTASLRSRRSPAR